MPSEQQQQAAITIQDFFDCVRLVNRYLYEATLSKSSISWLINLFDVRFACMKAVAAAKFSVVADIEDKDREKILLDKLSELAINKGVENSEGMKHLFERNMTLSKEIQFGYYIRIWDRRRDPQVLLNSAYRQLYNLITAKELPIDCNEPHDHHTSSEVLSLADNIINDVDEQIIDILSGYCDEMLDVTEDDLINVFNQMLANYMTPSMLRENESTIVELSRDMKEVSYRQAMRL